MIRVKFYFRTVLQNTRSQWLLVKHWPDYTVIESDPLSKPKQTFGKKWALPNRSHCFLAVKLSGQDPEFGVIMMKINAAEINST